MTSHVHHRSDFRALSHQSTRRWTVVLAIVFLLVAAQASFAQITTEVLIGDSVSDLGPKYADVDEAIKRFNNRDVLGTRQFLESAKRKNPNLPPTELLLAKMFFLGGNTTSGQVSLEQTVMNNPGDPEPYLLLGDQAISVGRTIDAEALYEKSMRLIEGFEGNAKRKRNFIIKARNGHSVVAERRKQWETAVEDLRALIEVDPDNAAAHYRLGRSLFMLNKQREGYDEFVKAQELDKELPNPYVASALMYEMLDKRAEAQKAFERAVSVDKTNLKTLTAYSQWLIQTGDAAKAETALAAARKIDAESVDVLSLSGVAARMAKKMKPAEDYFVSALRLAPSNGGVINQLALLLVDQPDDAKRNRAYEFAQINATLRPESTEANVTLAWVLYKMGRNRDAGIALRKGLQSGNLSPDSSYLVAQMLVGQDQKDAARQLLDNALENSDGSLFIMRQEAEALKKSLGGS